MLLLVIYYAPKGIARAANICQLLSEDNSPEKIFIIIVIIIIIVVVVVVVVVIS